MAQLQAAQAQLAKALPVETQLAVAQAYLQGTQATLEEVEENIQMILNKTILKDNRQQASQDKINLLELQIGALRRRDVGALQNIILHLENMVQAPQDTIHAIELQIGALDSQDDKVIDNIIVDLKNLVREQRIIIVKLRAEINKLNREHAAEVIKKDVQIENIRRLKEQIAAMTIKVAGFRRNRTHHKHRNHKQTHRKYRNHKRTHRKYRK